MVIDDVIKTLVGAVIGAIIAATTWIGRMSLGNKEKIILLENQVKRLEGDVAHLKDHMLTREDMRSVVEEALEKRDKISTERRKDWDRARKSEMRELVAQELDKLVPRLLRGLRGGPPTPNPPQQRPDLELPPFMSGDTPDTSSD